MLTLAPCPHCAARVPDDGAFCDTCGRPLAACPTCGELARPGEKCVTHGVAAVVRPAVKGGPAQPPPTPVATPTVAPPPRRGAAAPAAPSHAAQGTTVQPLAKKLRLVALGGVSLPPLEVDADTIVGRGEGPFAILLDPFHDKGLSRRHCQFRRGATGTWSITDLAGRGSTMVSADGTWTKAPLGQNASQPLEPGRDQVRLGSLTFRIEAIA